MVLDDLIATGGSAMGAQQLISLCGATVREFIFLIELTALCGKKKLNAPTFSIFEYDD